uniref:RING-type domain-containing protein n=1 Tax=Cyclophora tenuis TaxID=216820 RepID=A0A7S1GMU2_CYCTE|mmetsp:Transcript_23995/g.40779  ORF Transcript_23995/g.40779 Transcript_23995/m.40779 type:complete len:185 (+) Transcript_23995:104-658(+)
MGDRLLAEENPLEGVLRVFIMTMVASLLGFALVCSCVWCQGRGRQMNKRANALPNTKVQGTFSKVLTAECFVSTDKKLTAADEKMEPSVISRDMNAEDSAIEKDPNEQKQFVVVPLPGRSVDDKGSRLVPNLCSICLLKYESNVEITWSSNSSCEHCFHRLCIEKWLSHQTTEAVCPCCRRSFV